MLEKLKNFIYSQFSRQVFRADQEKYLYLAQFSATILAAAVHVFQFVFFALHGIHIFVLLNTASLCVYAVCFLLIHKNCFIAAGVLFTLEIAAYSTTAMLLLGVDSFVFLYLIIILLLQMLIPYASYKVRVPLIALIWFLLVFSIAMGLNTPPVIDISDFKLLYTMFNINMGIVGIIADIAITNGITRLISQYNTARLEKYRNEANRDMLTGLYNRRFAVSFFEKLKHNAFELNCCVAMLDIDDFKGVNDTYGHRAGDHALCAIADLLRASLRKTDTVFRWGGEEFLIFMMDVTVERGRAILEKVRAKLEHATLLADGNLIHLTVTIGLAPLDVAHIEHSIKESDKRLYAGKIAGKNRVAM